MELLRKKMPTYSRLQKPVLVLNASYEPINICAARRALVLVLKGIASAEELSAKRRPFAAPHRQRAVRDPSARIPPHSAPDPRAFAQEHSDARPLHLPVLPQGAARRRIDAGPRDSALARRRIGLGKSGGLLPSPATTAKGSRTPEEAGMKLARQPRPFSLHTSRHLMRLLGKGDEQWRKYLFY